jgi:mRNA deadenylase 3'-5' endonuclease subunit Ccr4
MCTQCLAPHHHALQACSYRSSLYNEAPSQAIQWQFRGTTVLQEILHWAPDVVCLQEVEHFEQLQRALQNEG